MVVEGLFSAEADADKCLTSLVFRLIRDSQSSVVNSSEVNLCYLGISIDSGLYKTWN